MAGSADQPGLSSLLFRTYRAAARAHRPEQGLAVVLASVRVAVPGSRVDVLVRGRGRSFRVVARAPLAELPLGLATAPADPASPAAEALDALGLKHRVAIAVRLQGVRAVLSVARGASRFTRDETRFLREVGDLLGPALAARARLDRAGRATERARFVQRFALGVSRSLDQAEILGAAARRMVSLLPLEAAELTVFTSAGTPGTRLIARAETSFEQVVAETLDADGPSPADDVRNAGCGVLHVLPLVARRRDVGVLRLCLSGGAPVPADAASLLRHVARPLAVAVENARLFQEAAHRTRQMTALYDVAQALSSAEDTDAVTERVLWILHETFEFRHSAVLRLETDHAGTDWLVLQASRGYSRRPDGSFRVRVGDRSITSRAATTLQVVHVPDVRRDPDYVPGVEAGRSEVAVPIEVGGRLIGVLDVESTTVNAFTAEDLETLKLFSVQVGLALQRARLFEDIRRQAMTDSLTGLLNQRYFQRKVEREIERSAGTGRPFALALVDLDDFKSVNDVDGHVVGNQVIVRLGEALQRRVRSIDAAARFGGDEFALVLSETDAAGALRVIHDFQEELRAARGITSGGRGIGVSVGIAEWRPGMTTLQSVLAAADAALYQAKRGGKNRAVVATAGETGDLPGGGPQSTSVVTP